MNQLKAIFLFSLALALFSIQLQSSDKVIKSSQQNQTAYEQWLVNNPQFTKPSVTILQTTLSPLQYKVTQQEGTERPYNNPYWDQTAAGIYVDVVSGEPLFSSADKYKSGTGWPSFTRAIAPQAMTITDDYHLFSRRSELRSSLADSHLGHLFADGPRPTGQRYCINSAALRFIPKDKLAIAGYPEFLTLFE